MKRDNIPLKEKYALTVTEASQYYNIGPRRLRLMADQHLGDFAVFSGNKYLILREKFEEFLKQTSSI
jgi:excisionase family DNA binding protein